MRRRRLVWIAAAAAAVVAAVVVVVVIVAVGGDETVSGPPPSAPDRLQVASPAFAADGELPVWATCDGAGRAPALDVHGVPSAARSLAVLVEDPDAPGGTYVHWTGWRIEPTTVRIRAPLPREGAASSGQHGYEPPCPPRGDADHRYRFMVYALRAPLDLASGASPAAVRDAIAASRPLAAGTLVGTFGRG